MDHAQRRRRGDRGGGDVISWIRRHPLGMAWASLMVLVALALWLIRINAEEARERSEQASVRAARRALVESMANQELLRALRAGVRQGRAESRAQTAALITWNECIVLLLTTQGEVGFEELRQCRREARQAGREARAEDERTPVSRLPPDGREPPPSSSPSPSPRPSRSPRPSPSPSRTPILCVKVPPVIDECIEERSMTSVVFPLIGISLVGIAVVAFIALSPLSE